MAKPEEAIQAVAPVPQAAPAQPAATGPVRPTQNLKQFYDAQPPMADTLRAAGGVIQNIGGGRIGLPTKADTATRMMPAPIANAVDLGTMAFKGLAGVKNPAISTAAAAPVPQVSAKPSPVQQPPAGMLGLPPVSPSNPLANTRLGQAQVAQPSGARSRPVAGQTQPKIAAGKPVANTAANQANGNDVPEGAVELIRGLTRQTTYSGSGTPAGMVRGEDGNFYAAGSTPQNRGLIMGMRQADGSITGRASGPTGMSMIDHETGDVVREATQGDWRNDPSVMGYEDQRTKDAADIERTKLGVAGGITQQQISTGGAISAANIAHGQSNKLKALEAKALADFAAALETGDGELIAKAQLGLDAVRGGVAGSEYAPLNIYDEMGNVTGQKLYNKKSGAVQEQGGGSVTRAQVDAAAKAKGITDPAQLKQLYSTYGIK